MGGGYSAARHDPPVVVVGPPSSDGIRLSRYRPTLGSEAAASANTAKLQAAIDQAASDGLPLILDYAGTLYINAAVTITKSGFQMRGMGARNTTIHQLTAAANGIEVNTDASGHQQFLSLADFRLAGPGVSTGIGLYLNDKTNAFDWVTIRRLEVQFFDRNIVSTGAAQTVFEACRVQNARINYDFSPTGSASNTVAMVDCGNSHASEVGINVGSASGFVIIGCEHTNNLVCISVNLAAQVTMLGGNFEAQAASAAEYILVKTNGVLSHAGGVFVKGSGPDIPAYRVQANATCRVTHPRRDGFTTSAGMVLAAAASVGVIDGDKDATGNFTSPVYVENYLGQRFVGNGFNSRPDNAIPAAAANMRGMIIHVIGRDGVADGLKMCRKAADGSYAWVDL